MPITQTILRWSCITRPRRRAGVTILAPETSSSRRRSPTVRCTSGPRTVWECWDCCRRFNYSCRDAALTIGRGRRGKPRLYFQTSTILQEFSALQFVEGLAQLLLRVHHNRAVPGYWLFQWLSGDEQEANPLISRLHRDLIAAIEEHERAIVGFGWRMRV